MRADSFLGQVVRALARNTPAYGSPTPGLRSQLDAVEKLHRRQPGGLCGECTVPHPCPTVRAARGEDPEAGGA